MVDILSGSNAVSYTHLDVYKRQVLNASDVTILCVNDTAAMVWSMAIGMSKSLAAEVASRNITVNCVAPGFITTAMTDALNDKQKEGILATVPAGRLGTAGEIAAAAVYLASVEAAYVPGQTMHVNGGMARI